jgi:hypothetical protein
VVLALRYLGCRPRIEIAPRGYRTRWDVDAAPRPGRGEHADGAPLGGGAPARCPRRRERVRRPVDVGAGHQRRAARRHAAHRHLHLMADRIRVDVADGSPCSPSIKDYATDAATGRGLTLFNTLASDWGVQPVMGGKIVWFELPVDYCQRPPGSPTGPSASTSSAGPARVARFDEQQPSVPVDLLGIPVALLQKASEEYEALFRELRLMKEHSRRSTATPRSSRAPLRAPLGDRDPVQRPGSRHGRELAGGRGPQDGDPYDWHLELPTSAGRRASCTTPCSTKRTSSAWSPSCSRCPPRRQRGRAPVVSLRVDRPATWAAHRSRGTRAPCIAS